MARVQADINLFLDGNFEVSTYTPSYHHTITLSSGPYRRELTLYFTRRGTDKASVESVTALIDSLVAIRDDLGADDAAV